MLPFIDLSVCLGTARIYDAGSQRCIAVLEGHDGEVSKVCFNPQGQRVLSGSADKTARLWDANTGTNILIFD